MNDIKVIKSLSVYQQKPSESASEGSKMPSGEPKCHNKGKDTFELSAAAQMLYKLSDVPDIRQDKIDEMVAKIRSNKLLTPPNLRHATAKMIIFSLLS